jgi:hypothetical protein
MDIGERLSLEQIRAFLKGNEEVGFKASNRKQAYEWTQRMLRAQEYTSLQRNGKGLVKQYIAKVTGLSRAQVTRVIAQYVATGAVQGRQGRGRRYTTRYTPEAMALLAEVDMAHDTLSGPATRQLLYRGWYEFADARYERLADISPAHIYNLRRERGYREHALFSAGPGPRRRQSASAASRRTAGGPATCGWTQFIRAIWTESRACITSTWWMRSRNGKWRERWSAFRKTISNPAGAPVEAVSLSHSGLSLR